MNNFIKKAFKLAILLAVLGLLLLTIVIVTNSVYPDMVFQVLAPAGTIMIFSSAGLFALDWVLHIKAEVKQKKYLNTFILVLLGIALVAYYWWKE